MDEPRRRPSPRAPRLWALTAASVWVPVLVVEVALTVAATSSALPALERWPRWIFAVVLAVSVAAAAVAIVVVPVWRYRVHRWDVSATAVYTRTGWFVQEHRIAPISRIQTVDTERGPFDRLLGLATVTVTTASAAGAVEITALDVETAHRVVADLTAVAAGTGEDAT
ncbi:PH domain-containing protein [Rhodococcus sp. HNM0569]|nr:PH domain-containing protein [Rhodococcus sp. HNM0569]